MLLIACDSNDLQLYSLTGFASVHVTNYFLDRHCFSRLKYNLSFILLREPFRSTIKTELIFTVRSNTPMVFFYTMAVVGYQFLL